MANFCKHCGARLEEGARFCPSCGAQMTAEPEKAFCSNCGAELAEGVRFCKKCGAPAAAAQPLKRFCAVCGAELKEGARFCKKCGASADSAAPAQPVRPAAQAGQPVPSSPGSAAAQAGYAHQNMQTTYASERARQARPIRASQQRTEMPPKKRSRFSFINLLLILICLALAFVGWRTIPDNIRKAKEPIQPFGELEDDPEVEADFEAAERGEYSRDGYVFQGHDIYSWLYGDD